MSHTGVSKGLDKGLIEIPILHDSNDVHTAVDSETNQQTHFRNTNVNKRVKRESFTFSMRSKMFQAKQRMWLNVLEPKHTSILCTSS